MGQLTIKFRQEKKEEKKSRYKTDSKNESKSNVYYAKENNSRPRKYITTRS